MRKIFLTTIILFVSFSINKAQFHSTGMGINIGLGQIKGNSPSLTSLSGSIFFDINTTLWNNLTFRAGFHQARKVEYFLPENRKGKYYPFVKYFSLQAVLKQKIGEKLFLEEGLGLIYLNDRTFSDTDDWSAGTIFSGLLGYDFRENLSGFTLGFGAEYAVAFSNKNASHVAVKVQSFYYF